MISKYLKSKNTIDQIKFPLDDEIISKKLYNAWHLKTHPGNTYYYLEDQFTEDEIELIKAIAKKLPKENSTIGDYGKTTESPEYRKSSITWININECTFWIYNKLTSLINEVNNIHFNFDLDIISVLQFTEYYSSNNGMYRAHIDANGTKNPINRKLSVVIQLSDPEEYEGGDLLLYYGKDPVCIKKKKGSMVFFPSFVLHEVTPVTSGCRRTLVGWIEGPQFR